MRVTAEHTHNRWHPDIPPAAHVRPGDVLTLECRDGLDGQLTPASTHADCGGLDLGGAHPLTGPVFVEGASPGDVLEVELLEYETPDFGVNAVIPAFGLLAAGIAHEVGNPLAGISSLIQMIRRKDHNPYTNEKLELDERQLGRIQRTIRELVEELIAEELDKARAEVAAKP